MPYMVMMMIMMMMMSMRVVVVSVTLSLRCCRLLPILTAGLMATQVIEPWELSPACKHISKPGGGSRC